MLQEQTAEMGLKKGLATRVDEWDGYDGGMEAVNVGGWWGFGLQSTRARLAGRPGSPFGRSD